MNHVPARPLLRSIKSFCKKVVDLLGSRFRLLHKDAARLSTNFIHTAPARQQPESTHSATATDDVVRLEGQSRDVRTSVSQNTCSTDCAEAEEQWFGATRHIPHEKLHELAISHLGNKHGDKCEVDDICEGSYNRVHIMRFADGTKYTIRVPAWGTEDRWLDGDAIALRSQACTMKYIKHKTNLPVPEVLAYSTTCNNILGHPYMITTFLEGRQVCDVWEDGTPGPEHEAKRIAILRSIAHALAKLSPLVFDAAGTLYFNDGDDCEPEVGPLYVLEEGNSIHPHTASFEPIVKESYKDARAKLSQWWRSIQQYKPGAPSDLDKGMFLLLATMIDCLPFHKSKILIDGDNDHSGNGKADDPSSQAGGGQRKGDADTEDNDDSENDQQNATQTFVLAPPDLNWQNILVDESGNVTGLLDWDKVCTVPRYLGWSRLPIWLSEDYDLNYAWEGEIGNSEHDLERYRQAYANFMSEAMEGSGDCQFTAKSHLFQALYAAIEDPLCTMSFLDQVVRVILPRTHTVDYLVRISAGWKPNERVWLRQKLGALFDCKPGADYRLSF